MTSELTIDNICFSVEDLTTGIISEVTGLQLEQEDPTLLETMLECMEEGIAWAGTFIMRLI